LGFGLAPAAVLDKGLKGRRDVHSSVEIM
jgi:hypothetical protein